MSEDTRTILKKLMRDALDEKDRQRLLCPQFLSPLELQTCIL